MPYKHELTWIQHAKRWRKRYLNRTYYLKTPCNGRKDRPGYIAALREWERLKAFIDGLGPNPYTETGALIPESQVLNATPVYVPPVPAIANGQHNGIGQFTGRSSNGNGNGRKPRRAVLQPARSRDDSPLIQSVGVGPALHPELVVDNGDGNGSGNPYADERRIGKLAKFWLDQRRKQVDRNELSFSQWDEDRSKLQSFRDFLFANYPTVVYVDDIDPAILNLYRDKQWEFVDSDNGHRISKVTLRKRLAVVAKWLTWLVDQNILAEPPKDLRTYGRVKLDKPTPLFWSIDEIKRMASKATDRTRLYLMLAVNLGYLQKDIATLEPNMVDWETGIVTRDRHKTGVPTKAKLWNSTLALLQEHRNPTDSGPLLVDQNRNPLYVEKVNAKGNAIRLDAIGLAFNRVKQAKKTGFKGDKRSFKHLRKSAANEIEKVRPDLTSLFLGHSEKGTKRFYVDQHYTELFAETDKLAKVFGFAK